MAPLREVAPPGNFCHNAATFALRRCFPLSGVDVADRFDAALKRYGLPLFQPEWTAVCRGIEKECLRVTPEGRISLRPHPAALGSALKNPYITTDFSEALLEFITPKDQSIDSCLGTLENIHRFTLENMEEGEILWASSMPCPAGMEGEVPIATYGSSNIGRLKQLYRIGLSYRYDSLMQAIAGIHYNFSMPDEFWQPYQRITGFNGSLKDFRTESYLHLIRNFHRHSWLLLYLFGASPAAATSFVEGREHHLQRMETGTMYLPDATCLRMGRLGYQSEAQKSLFVCYNDLPLYVECLQDAIKKPYAPYEEIGHKVDGSYRQINVNLLQLENEFYSTIRPKRVARSGERPLDALVRGGVEYVELRLLDLNPYLPLGIDAEQVRFLDTFLLHCLLSESPQCNRAEFFDVADNILRVVEEGRDTSIELKRGGKPAGLADWAGEFLDDMKHSAALMDHFHGGGYLDSVERQAAKIQDPALTPSAMMLADMERDGLSFCEFSMAVSKRHADTLTSEPLGKEVCELMETTAAESLVRQREVEAADKMSFDEFLRDWNAWEPLSHAYQESEA